MSEKMLKIVWVHIGGIKQLKTPVFIAKFMQFKNAYC